MWEGGRCVPAQEEKGRKRRGGASVCGGGVRWCACGGRGRATFVTITRTSQPHKVRSSLLVSRLPPRPPPFPFHHLPSPRAHLGNTEIEEPPDEPRRRMDRHRLRQRSPAAPATPSGRTEPFLGLQEQRVAPPSPRYSVCPPRCGRRGGGGYDPASAASPALGFSARLRFAPLRQCFGAPVGGPECIHGGRRGGAHHGGAKRARGAAPPPLL